jgi:Skp family chaperone for outer membrane proteins
MNHLCHFLFFACLFSSLTFIAAPASAEAPSSATMVKETAEKAVKVRQESQKLADGWAKEAADFQTEIQSLEQELEAIKWRREKTASYMKDLEDKMTALKAKEQAAHEIRNELEPFLDQTLQALQHFSLNDLPMLTEMQAPRLRSVAGILNNADANIVQKTRSLLEATTQALEYGYFPEPGEAEIDIDGKLIRVHRLNVGRLALFALSGDGRDAWKWHRETGRYEPVPHFARSIQEVIQITERSRLVSLVELPVGTARELVEEKSQ